MLNGNIYANLVWAKFYILCKKKSFVLFSLPIYMEYVSMHYSSLFFEHFS